MILAYTPEGAEPRKWSFKPEKLMSSEAEAIEKATHLTYAEFGVDLLKGSATCRRALLWVLLKREDPPLRLAQVDPPVGSIVVEFDTDELIALREQAAQDTSLEDDERAQVLEQLDAEIGDATPAPKAPESGSA